MRHTVIAVFDESEQAEKAAAAVRARGFDESSVHLALRAQASDAEQVPPAARIEGGPLTGLLHRLAALFGVEEPHLAHYEEAVRRGGSVVQVDTADEAEAAKARDTLLDMGAVNIDDRVQEWQRAGWRGTAGEAGGAGVVHRHEVSIGGVRVYGRPVVAAFDELAGDFRRDFEAHEAGPGRTYEDAEPAYRYGHSLASDIACAGRSWDEIEPEARARWERGHPGRSWERFKRCVRHAWEHAAER